MTHSGVGLVDTGEIFSALRLCRVFLPHLHLNSLKAWLDAVISPGWSLISCWYKPEEAPLMSSGINHRRTRREQNETLFILIWWNSRKPGACWFSSGSEGNQDSSRKGFFRERLHCDSSPAPLPKAPRVSGSCQLLPPESLLVMVPVHTGGFYPRIKSCNWPPILIAKCIYY